jgi:hypothetical protein
MMDVLKITQHRTNRFSKFERLRALLVEELPPAALVRLSSGL